MILKGFFDGGNEADSIMYETVTLASFLSTPDYWKKFDNAWSAVLRKHHAPPLHTTDAVSLKNDFDGWETGHRDEFVDDCVSVIEKSAAIFYRDGKMALGLIPCTVTIVLKDFKRAQIEIPDCPRDATEVCAVQSVNLLFRWGKHLGAHSYHLYFDQNEPFRGHVVDRWKNKRAKADMDIFQKVTHCDEANMRIVPALQAADMLAWSAGHRHSLHAKSPDWQRRIIGLNRSYEWLDWEVLSQPINETAEFVTNRWKLPRRKPTR